VFYLVSLDSESLTPTSLDSATSPPLISLRCIPPCTIPTQSFPLNHFHSIFSPPPVSSLFIPLFVTPRVVARPSRIYPAVPTDIHRLPPPSHHSIPYKHFFICWLWERDTILTNQYVTFGPGRITSESVRTLKILDVTTRTENRQFLYPCFTMPQSTGPQNEKQGWLRNDPLLKEIVCPKLTASGFPWCYVSLLIQ
jgi:hypothetical protein